MTTGESKPDVTSSNMNNTETTNNCPECGKEWKDINPTPGVIHRTKLCILCKLKSGEDER